MAETPDSPETPDTKDNVPDTFETGSGLEISSRDDGSTDENEPTVALNLSPKYNHTNTQTTTKKTETSRLNSIEVNHAMLDSYLTLYGRSSILKSHGESRKRNFAKHLKVKHVVSPKSNDVPKKIGVAFSPKKILLVGKSGKATKKQLLDSPEREGLGGEPLGEIGPEGGPGGLGGDMEGVPTGMGAGAEPLGAYESQHSQNNLDPQQQSMEEGGEYSNGPLGFSHHGGEMHEMSLGKSPLDLDPNALKMASYGSPHPDHTNGLDPNQLTENPGEIESQINSNLGPMDKSVNIQGDHEIGEIVQHQQHHQHFSPMEGQSPEADIEPYQEYPSSYKGSLKRFEEDDDSLGKSEIQDASPQEKTEDNFWNKNGNIQFIDSRQEGDKQDPQSDNLAFDQLDREAERYDKNDNYIREDGGGEGKQENYMASNYFKPNEGNYQMPEENNVMKEEPNDNLLMSQQREIQLRQHQLLERKLKQEELVMQQQRKQESEYAAAENEESVKERMRMRAEEHSQQRQRDFEMTGSRRTSLKRKQPALSLLSYRGARQRAETLYPSHVKQLAQLVKSQQTSRPPYGPMELTAISTDVLNMEQVAFEKKKRKKKRTNVVNNLLHYLLRKSSSKKKQKHSLHKKIHI